MLPAKVSAWENLTGGDHGGADWTISTNTSIAGVHTNIGVFTVNTGITATVQAYDNGVNSTYGKLEINANSVNIVGTLTGTGSGYRGAATANGGGPGGGIYINGIHGGGGSHGGIGANVNTGTGSSVYYDSIMVPIDMGSAGGASYSGGAGGNGGGAIKIVAATSFAVSGTISSVGNPGSSHGGGGAGGSIYLSASTFSGSGTINASGSTSGGFGGGGGGGRISINYSTSNSLSGTISAILGPGGDYPGENGTIVFYDSTNNDLLIKHSQTWTTQTDLGGSSYTFRNVTLNNSSTWTQRGTYSTNSNGVGFTFNTTNFTVETGSTIRTAGYKGLLSANGAGPGGGGYINGQHSGGGGYGGVGSSGGAPGGITYGSSTVPVDLGSAGGGNYNNTAKGGDGGGAIKVISSSTFTLAGTISSTGYTGNTHSGGGSGGSIYIIAATLTGGGTISANGGPGSGAGGNGGGGRIAINYSVANNLSVTPTVTKGTGGTGTAGDGTYVTSAIPQIPSSLSQFKSDGTTAIATAAETDETTVILKVTMAAGSSMTITPEIEIRDIDTSFSDVATNTGTGVAYSGTPVVGSVTISSLTDLTNFHWQSRLCSGGYCSEWVERSGSPYDFRVFTNQPPDDPTSLGPASLINGSSTGDTSPTLTFTLADPDETNEVYFTIVISSDSDYTPSTVEYISAQGAQGSASFTVGQTLSGGMYTAGSIGQSLTAGSYYWRVKTTDENGAESDWVEARVGLPAFSIDTTTPTNNASNLGFSNATSGNWTNLEPTITWTAGTDGGAGSILGYCLAISETAIGDPTPSDDPTNTSGVLASIDDGVSETYCPFIATGTSLNLSGLSGLSLTTNKHYYISLAAVDTAGNFYAGDNSEIRNLISFKYDTTIPTNVTSISAAGGSFSNIDDMYFSWPTSGGNAASDTGSGLLGYQYSINDQLNWHGSTTDSNTGLSIIPLATSTPFNLETSRDSSYVDIGDNTIYFRSVDLAGNISLSSTYRTASIAYGGEAPTFPGDAELTVTAEFPDGNTQPSSETNSFALSWDAADPSTGRTIDSYYYMVNTTPPTTLATITSNSATYIPSADTVVEAAALPGVVRGSNTIYVVVADDLDNYSPSSAISTTFSLNTENPDSPKNLTASDASIKAVSLWRASLAWETPDYTGLGDLTYTIQRSTDGTTWTTVGTTDGTAYVDTVSTSSLFYWRVGTSDSSDASIASPSYSNAVTLTPKGSYTSSATLTSGPSVSDITTKKAKITWTTSRNSDSKIAYGTTSGDYLDEEPSNSSQVTNHEINLNNLAPGTTYYYLAKWTDEDGNTGTSGEKTFKTESAPVIKEAVVASSSITSAIINFTSIHAVKVKVYYGKTTDFGGAKEVATSKSESSYSVVMENLDDGTKYYYKLNGFDSEGAEYEGEIHSFETLPRPRVTDVTLQQVADTAETTILVTWLSNTAISSVVTVYPTDDPSNSRDIVDLNLKDGEHSMVVTSLLPATVYTLIVKGSDKSGNLAESAAISFTTASDTRAPAIINLKIIGGTIPPVGFAAGTVNAQLVVTWDTDEPATSQVEFGEGTGSGYSQKTSEDGNLTTNHVVVISGLTPSQVYHLRAISKDSGNNEGLSIDTVTIAPKATRSALDLVISSLSQIFGNINFFGN